MTKFKQNRRYHYLTCFTAEGYPRYQALFDSKQQAVSKAETLIKDGQALNYKIVRLPDVSALEEWLDSQGWKVDINYQDGEVYAELERYSERGVDFILYTKMTPRAYWETVENIDPNYEVLKMWQGDPSYRSAMGDLATAWNDINDLKQTLVKQLKTLNV